MPRPPDTWRLVITGCGTSHLNPPWGMPQAWSLDPRDRRRRSGGAILGPDGQVMLIDAGPDLAHQLRDPFCTWDGVGYPRDCITRCDAVLLTHDHADHCHGLNDLRHLNRLMADAGEPSHGIPLLGWSRHLERVQAMFPYCFGVKDEPYDLAVPLLRPQALEDGASVELAGLRITALAASHGLAGRVTAWRCGGLAWLSDVKELPAAADRHLQDLDLLALDMLREELHPTHFNWDEAQAVIDRLRPRRTVLIHMGWEVRFAEWERRLPPGVELAVDGWTATFPA